MKELKAEFNLVSKRDYCEHTFSYTWTSVVGIEESHIEMLHKCAKVYIMAIEKLSDTQGGELPKYNAPLDYVGTYTKII